MFQGEWQQMACKLVYLELLVDLTNLHSFNFLTFK